MTMQCLRYVHVPNYYDIIIQILCAVRVLYMLIIGQQKWSNNIMYHAQQE